MPHFVGMDALQLMPFTALLVPDASPSSSIVADQIDLTEDLPSSPRLDEHAPSTMSPVGNGADGGACPCGIGAASSMPFRHGPNLGGGLS